MEKLSVREQLLLSALLKTNEDSAKDLLEGGVSQSLSQILKEDIEKINSIRNKLELC